MLRKDVLGQHKAGVWAPSAYKQNEVTLQSLSLAAYFLFRASLGVFRYQYLSIFNVLHKLTHHSFYSHLIRCALFPGQCFPGSRLPLLHGAVLL